MKRFSGFRLGRRLARVCRRIRSSLPRRRRPNPSSYHRLDPITPSLPNRLLRLFSAPKPSALTPKGHLAVYVTGDDGGLHRVLVPVIHFNHPLFGELLREAEEKFGFQHPGGITIPCPIEDFERVRSRVAAEGGKERRKMLAL